MRKRMIGILGVVVAAGGLVGVTVQAGVYTWASAVSGNWNVNANWNPNSGYPQATTDTATINATGGAYTVTVNAAKTIGALTLNSANATLNASSTLTSTASPTFTAGAVQGNLGFAINASAITVDPSALTLAGATTMQFTRYSGGEKSAAFNVSSVPANLTFDVYNTDAPYSRGNMFITSATGYINYGTVKLRTVGNDYGGPGIGDIGNECNVVYTITTGTLTNRNSLTLDNGNSPGAPPEVIFNGVLLNDTTGTFTGKGTGRPVVLNTAGAAHENRGTWNVTGTGGLAITGPGTSLTQNGATASLTASYLKMNNTVAGSSNSFTVNAGSLTGFFDFVKTTVSIAPGVTTGANTYKFYSFANPGQNTFCNFDFPGLAANQVLDIRNTNNLRGGVHVTTVNGYTNYGQITIQTDDQDYGNATYEGEAYHIVTNGTLINRGQIAISQTLTDGNAVNAEAMLDAQLLNDTGGTITMGSKSGRAILGSTGDAHINRGLLLLTGGTNNLVNGATLTNGAGGVIRNNGVSVTLSGTATLDNALGTIQAIEGAGSSTFTVANPLAANTKSGTVLAGGTWRVQSAANATALNVTNGSSWNITQVGTDTPGGPATSIILDGANASFTQLESGSLNKVGVNGKLTLLNGKILTVPNLTVAGRLAGNGTVVGNVSLQGGVIAPGSSPGTQTITGNMTWGGGSTYDWEVDQVVSGGGNQSLLQGVDPGFDFLSISGTLDITATSANPFLLDIAGLAHPSHALGAVTNWDPTYDYSWVIASAAGGITGFNDRSFAFSGADFYSNNSIAGHRFWVAQSGNDLLLVYIVPEPATLALLALAGAALVSRRRR